MHENFCRGNMGKENINPILQTTGCSACCVCNLSESDFFKAKSADCNFWMKKCKALYVQLQTAKAERNHFKLLHDDLLKKRTKRAEVSPTDIKDSKSDIEFDFDHTFLQDQLHFL